jgi:hypothetical protein
MENSNIMAKKTITTNSNDSPQVLLFVSLYRILLRFPDLVLFNVFADGDAGDFFVVLDRLVAVVVSLSLQEQRFSLSFVALGV